MTRAGRWNLAGNDVLGEAMGYGFLAVIVVFSVAAAAYLWVNDFNKETYPIVFPAIGAIALSGYLGIKTIWIDEEDPQQSKVTIAFLHDRPPDRSSR